MARRDTFQAIADPTRREILRLVAYEPKNVNAIAENFAISRQAVSLQLKILVECGLVEISRHGRERQCKARLESLNEVAEWVDQFRQFWQHKLDALDMHVQNMQTPEGSHITRTKR